MDPLMYKTEDGNFVHFTWDVARNEAESTKQGRPIFDKVLRAHIHTPGSKNQEAVHEVERHFSGGSVRTREHVRQRFAVQLQAFTARESSPDLAGTPLSAWPALGMQQVAELRALNVHTVEALAELPDTGLQHVGMGARELQAKAKAFLAAAKGNAETERLAAELAKRDEVIARLEAQVADLAALAEKKKRKDAA